MREILFRGKTLESGRWIYGDLRQWSSGHVGICDRETNRTIKVEAESVGQYIGLKDKAGTRIFEGDIVKAVLPQTDCRAGVVWPARSVDFFDGCFGLDPNPNYFDPFHSYAPTVMFEVIGNVHDNPELIEVDHAAD